MSFFSDQAQQFKQMAADIQTRLDTQGNSMDQTTYDGLEEKRDGLEHQSALMTQGDIDHTLSEIKADDQAKIAGCTKDLGAAIKKIAIADKVLGFAAAALDVATAMVTGDTALLSDAFDAAEKALNPPKAAATLPAKPAAAAGGLSLAASGDPDPSSGNS